MEENQKEIGEQKKKKERKTYSIILISSVLALVFKKYAGYDVFSSDELLTTIFALFAAAISFIKLAFFLKD